jgi:hypothetical protein
VQPQRLREVGSGEGDVRLRAAQDVRVLSGDGGDDHPVERGGASVERLEQCPRVRQLSGQPLRLGAAHGQPRQLRVDGETEVRRRPGRGR